MQKKRRRKKRSPAFKFFKILFLILVIYFIFILGIFAYSYLTYDPNKEKENPNFIDKIVEATKPVVPEHTNVLIACTDEGEGRTDAIMLASFNSINGKLSLVSIPRDTRVDIPPHQWEVMVQNYPEIANDNPSRKRINAIPSYGNERGMEFLQEYLEDLLGIKIDYTVHFNLEGFRYIVDSVGGIEFDVPIKMRHPDPYIHLDPGLQLLDGNKAEQLLRFRKGYATQDLQRVEVQQQFLKKFIKKITSIDTILSKPSAYFTTITKYLDTNVGISDVLKYLPYLKSFDVSNVVTYTLPGTVKGNIVEVDKEEALEFGYEVFKKPTLKSEEIIYEDSFDKSIMILNGSGKSGVATKAKKLLENSGYSVKRIGDYMGLKTDETRIYVEKDNFGNDLKKFFTTAQIIADPHKIKEFGYDIVIIIGINEELNELELNQESNSENQSEENQ